MIGKVDHALTNGDTSKHVYEFPSSKLRKATDKNRIPLVLVACGSFNPITFLHLRMFEMARDWIRFNTSFEVVGGYLSPVGDAYKKAGLSASHHRIKMCQAAVEQTSNWIDVDPWEAQQKQYMPTARVLDHFEYELNDVLGGVECNAGRRRVRVALLAGADLIETMSTPNLWSEADLEHILGHHGVFVIERAGTDIDMALAKLKKWKDKIYVIHQSVQNDVSSTKVRLFLEKDMSIRYLIPESAIRYIETHHLYHNNNKNGSLMEEKV